MLDESEFQEKAEALLEMFADEIELKDVDMLIDADLQQGILTLELESGHEYVISKHNVSKQIWLSSPLSGGLHYDYNAEKDCWELTKDSSRLDELLTEELYKLTSVTFDFIGE